MSSLVSCAPIAGKISLVERAMSLDSGGALMKVCVVVMPKQSVLDPQGVAVRNALKDAGLQAVESVRVGKVLELELTAPPDEQRLDEICRDLLSNPVIEEYAIRYPSEAAQASGMSRY
jgi:phosphoribosylformylglycinamidine synthase PurS subunit